MSKKPVAISRLADYASDPDGFIARDGAARNPEAAVYGNRAHNNAVSGGRGLQWKSVMLLGAAYALAVLLVLYFLSFAFGGWPS